MSENIGSGLTSGKLTKYRVKSPIEVLESTTKISGKKGQNNCLVQTFINLLRK